MRRWVAPIVAALLAGCQTLAPQTPAQPSKAPTASIVALYRQPAERALLDGIRLYEDGGFERAEQALRNALSRGLADPRDTANAHKYLAFIACAFNRLAECEQQFSSAFGADPAFSLTSAEAGHPIWGPVYKRLAVARAKR